MQKRVYLSGAICKEQESFCRSWRNRIKNSLSNRGDIILLDPIEDKNLDNEYDAEKIVKDDLFMVRSSDLFVAEMTMKDYSYIGTAMEMCFAHMLDIPIYVWGDAYKDHYFIQVMSTKRYKNIGQLINSIEDFCNQEWKFLWT